MPNSWSLRCLLIVWSFFLVANLSGQDLIEYSKANNIDSIPAAVLGEFRPVLAGDRKIASLFPLIESLCRNDPSVALQIVEELLLDKRSKKYTKNWAVLLYFKIWVQLENYSENEELELFNESMLECATFFDENKEPQWLAKSYSLLSSINYNISYNNDDSLYTKALSYNEEALQLLLGTQDGLTNAYSILGEIYRIKGNICFKQAHCLVDSALHHYDKGLQYYSLNKDQSGMADILLNKAIVFADLDLYVKASIVQEDPIDYFQEAINACEDTNDLLKVRLAFAIYFHNKFKSTNDEKWNEQSNAQLKEVLKAADLKKSDAYFQLMVNTQNYLAYAGSKLSEIEQTQMLDSLVYFYGQTLSFCKAENNLKVYNELFKRLSISCPYFPKEKCSELLTIADAVKTHFIQKNKVINQGITAMNKSFRDAMELEERRNLILMGIIFFMLILLVITLHYQKQKRKDLKKTLAIKQEALRAQMNPHFISNTINAIESLVNQERNEEASEYLIDFSRLCRLVIDHSRYTEITLYDEIDSLKYFLSLEKLRLSDDLEYSISVDNQLSSKMIMVPPLILQPFVENAIWHGIKNKPEPKRGELKIEVNKLSEYSIECIVEDNGVGREKARAIQGESVIDQKSWGMSLTKERIRYLEKGDGAGIELIDLYDENAQASGTKVKITLPITMKKQTS